MSAAALLSVSYGALAIGGSLFLGRLMKRNDDTAPTPPPRPAGSENHPSGRHMGCPDSIEVHDGVLCEVWLR